MMILLVLYKNYCKPSKTLSEEQLNAAVTAAAEEEDRALQAALEATSFYTALDKRRQSMENTSQVLLSPRFSSVGGGYSHLAPPLKDSVMQQRGKSLPGSVLQFGSAGSPSFFHRDDKCNYISREDDLDRTNSEYINSKNQLNIVPSRRVSSVTCFSADSAYLERRCSAFEMGLPVTPHFPRQSKEKLLGPKEPPWDYYYPIDIQVIQPTPEMSPTASERNLNEDHTVFGLQVPGIHDQMHNLSVNNLEIGLAPLASISSLGGFSQSSSNSTKTFNSVGSNTVEAQEKSVQDSTGSDSVFMDVDELATDSEFEYDGFDDDYSFCESKPKSQPGRTDVKALQFASFDSCDTSINQDVRSEIDEEEISGQQHPTSSGVKQHSTDFTRHPSLHEGTRVRRKLVKTYSEPKSSRASRGLPPPMEKSGCCPPKRQMSSPSRRSDGAKPSSPKNTTGTSPKHRVDANGGASSERDLNFLLPPSSEVSSGDGVTFIPLNHRSVSVTSSSPPTQGLNNDMPFQRAHKQLSLPSTQERRSRLQKQKNFVEEIRLASNKSIDEKTEETEPKTSSTLTVMPEDQQHLRVVSPSPSDVTQT
ncbi:hypothetical protein RUM44_008089 [Polyplax serrata]|uniref:Uncharacterized protein n=1 Tax=Polyplax serrata TaxID=468196 RepID=A0ABR1BBG2_POLSC